MDNTDELDKRTTPQGLLRYAQDYYRGFEIIHTQAPKGMEMYQVKFFLLCHSMELAMKSLLRLKGYSRKQLMNDFGHDLVKILQELGANEIIFDKKSYVVVSMANQLYKTKQFEYFQTGYKELPAITDLASTSHLFITKMLYRLQNPGLYTDGQKSTSV